MTPESAALRKRCCLALVACLSLAWSAPAVAEDVVIDFEGVPFRTDPTNEEVLNRPERYEKPGVVFQLANPPKRSKARGRIMFFPHLGSGHRGILNAMANEQETPVRVRFPRGASAVSIVFWASTGASARLIAFDDEGKVVARDEIKSAPGRDAPEDPVPMFTLSVKSSSISYVEFSGPRTGEYLAADEVRFVPLAKPRDGARADDETQSDKSKDTSL